MIRRRSAVWVIVLFLVVYVLGTAGIYQVLMSQRVAAVWDFYQLWYGARLLLLEHRDPYDPQVALEMQQALYGRPALPSEGQPAFYYPLPLLLLVAPLALLPYPLAAAAWLCLLLFAVAGAVGATLWGMKWSISPLGVAGLVLWALALYPVLWSVVLGQVAGVLLLSLNVGLAALLHRRQWLAATCLAFCALKPQLVYLLLPLLGLWALAHRRWRVLAGLAITLAVLGGIAWLLLPAWPARFLAQVTTYASISPFAAPLQILLEGWLRLPGGWLWIAVAVLLLGCCLALWVLAREESQRLAWAAGATLIVSALVIPRTGMINQLTLLWPALLVVKGFWFRRRWGRFVAVALLLAMAAVPWVGVATVTVPPGAFRYEVEHQILSPLLPVLLGSASVAHWAMLRWSGSS